MKYKQNFNLEECFRLVLSDYIKIVTAGYLFARSVNIPTLKQITIVFRAHKFINNNIMSWIYEFDCNRCLHKLVRIYVI